MNRNSLANQTASTLSALRGEPPRSRSHQCGIVAGKPSQSLSCPRGAPRLEIWKPCVDIKATPGRIAVIIVGVVQVSAIIEHLVWWEGQKVNE